MALNWWWNQYTRVQFNWIHAMLDNTGYTVPVASGGAIAGKGYSQTDIFAARFQIEF